MADPFPLHISPPRQHRPPALRIFRIILVVAGCLHLCGGHYGVLQVLAWGKMMVDYSAENGLIEGARRTLDGNHPCEMCLSIAEAKKEESRDPQAPAPRDGGGLELKNLLSPKVFALKTPRCSLLPENHFLPPLPARANYSRSPETPPPRSA